MLFANALIVACGAVPFPAGVAANAVPVATFTRLFTSENEFASPMPFVLLVPKCVASLPINAASAYTDATVVTSLIKMKLFGSSVYPPPCKLHGPSAAINAIAALFVPGASPGLPPVATIYNWLVDDGHV
jgi:hypothetical protein